ncbi:hypothetical protein ACGFX8_35765 [Streptomyces sp. NPDC048362]|uniref:hypothetical protein n=1 Tax=Streptomyces sp. NPDC048362 TaxID=3365539 RepID=UPI00371527BE
MPLPTLTNGANVSRFGGAFGDDTLVMSVNGSADNAGTIVESIRTSQSALLMGALDDGSAVERLDAPLPWVQEI